MGKVKNEITIKLFAMRRYLEVYERFFVEDLSNKAIKPRVLCEKCKVSVDDVTVGDVMIFMDYLQYAGYCIIFLSEDKKYCRAIPIYEIDSCASDDTDGLKIVLPKGIVIQIIKVGNEEL